MILSFTCLAYSIPWLLVFFASSMNNIFCPLWYIDPWDYIYLFVLFWSQSLFNSSNLLKPSFQCWPQLQALSLEISVQTKACWYVFQEIQSWCRLHLSAPKMRSKRFSKLPSILILLNHFMHYDYTNPIINVCCTVNLMTIRMQNKTNIGKIYDCQNTIKNEEN